MPEPVDRDELERVLDRAVKKIAAEPAEVEEGDLDATPVPDGAIRPVFEKTNGKLYMQIGHRGRKFRIELTEV